jgi:hypothetical protein
VSESEKEAEAQAAAAVEAATKEAEAKEAAATKAAAKENAIKDAELPEWARNELTRVRNEAAQSRISLRDTVAKFEGAKTPKEFEAAVKEYKAENTRLAQDLARNKVGTKYKLPAELIAVLTGDTPEALDAHGKILSKFVGAKAPGELRGGLDPNGDDGAFDPVAEAHKARANRY